MLQSMHSSLRGKVVLFFLVVVAALIIASIIGYRQLADKVRAEAISQMESKLDHVSDVLEATNTTYLDLVRSSMRVLKMEAARLGPPRIEPRSTPGQVPRLFFGSEEMGSTFRLVDEVKSIMGGTATIFVKDGDRFVRVTTNIIAPSGERAVGTILDPKGKAIAAIREGNAFYGVVDILGKPYITGYEPIRNEAGQTIGIYYVGYALETLAAVRDAVTENGILARGFFALLDPQNHVIFSSTGPLSKEEIANLALMASRGESSADWFFQTTIFEPWDYEVVAALHLPDVKAIAVRLMWRAYSLTLAVIAAVLLVSFWLATKLSHALEAAEVSRREAESARDAAEAANQTKSAFLANMSHELRTPMNAIIGYSEMLIEEAEDLEQEDFIPDLQKIRAAGKHLLALINDVLDLSKIEAGKMTVYYEDFDVADMLGDVVSTIKPLIEKNSNQLEVQIEPGIGRMASDLTKVRQTLFNLLSNASKFTEKGMISLNARRSEVDGKDIIRFSVTDTGIGMSPEQLGKLFQAFTQADDSTTRKYGGTGLGLVISRKFCQMLGGDIAVESEAGKGSTFTVELPVRPAIPQESGSAPDVRTSPAATERKTILVIDDDASAAELVRRMLEKNGFAMIHASSGAEGIRLARERLPSAITLDVMMPGMDGWTVLSNLKSDPRTSAIPVVIVTMLHEKGIGYALGADDYLTKPIDSSQLRATLSRHGVAPKADVLVVEDNAENREMFVRLLKKEGLRVTEAENGAIGLECLSKSRPAVILLDLMMPVMDGFEFLLALRKIPEHVRTPVIVVTAKDLTDEDRQRLSGSVESVMEKGALDRERLLQDVLMLLGKPDAPPSKL